MLKRKIAYFWIALVCVLSACSDSADEVILIGSGEETVQETEKGNSDSATDVDVWCDSAEPALIRVYVCGAVEAGGVVKVPEGCRVEDVLEAAGGLSEGADRYYLNLADWVSDGQMIYVPTEEEVAAGRFRTTQSQGTDMGSREFSERENSLVNINTADIALLCTLPGIGEGRAADIIAYRQEHGFFQSCEDIMSVPGIKSGIYEKICDKITVDERLGP